MTAGDIHGYYTPGGLYDRIVTALGELGKDLTRLTLDDLQPVDEFHIRGSTATRELIELSGFTSDMHVRFMHFNNLDEMAEQKYKDISQVRFESPLPGGNRPKRPLRRLSQKKIVQKGH